MGLNQPQNNYEVPQNNMFQTSVSITKQDQTQSYSNSTMCHTLSTAENLAYRMCLENNDKQYIFQFFEGYKPILAEKYQNQKLIFDAYDSFDGGKKKPIKDLAVQLIFQIENFKGDYSYYKSHYLKYDYPRNLSQEQIIKLIYHWYSIIDRIEMSNENFRQYNFSKYYKNLILVLNDQKSIDYSQDIYNLEADNPNRGQMDPNVVMKAYGKINKYNDKYVSNNAKTKEVELYGQNSLKINNNTNPKNNPSGKGKGGGANPQYPGSNNQPKQHGKNGGSKKKYDDFDEDDNMT